MKNLLLLVVMISAPFLASAQKLVGKTFKPTEVEIGGQKTDPKETVPYVFEFVDDKNMMVREMKENYYLTNHATYSIKNNMLNIVFLKGNRTSFNFQIMKFEEDKLLLKENSKLITLERIRN